jgi:hypothetical protein
MTLSGGLHIYRVKLVGGPADGQTSIASHDTVWAFGEKYVRGADDRYYHEPKAGGKN